jgi:hypothetical protein
VAEPFQGGLEAHTAALADRLMRRGHEVSLFAAPGSDPRFGARVLPVSRHRSSAIARRDVAAPPETWMQEHHAYLALMLELMRDGDRYDVVHNNSLHHLPIAMASAISPPLVTTLHTSGMAPRRRCHGHPERRRHRQLGARPRRRAGGVERAPRAREGAAPGDRRRSLGRLRH